MASITIDARAFQKAAARTATFSKIAASETRKALRDAGNIARKAIRAELAPSRRSGKVIGAVRVRASGAGINTRVTVRSGGPVAHLLDMGARPHDEIAGKAGGPLGGSGQVMTIRSRGTTNSSFAGMGGKAVRGAGADVLALRTRVHHPGMAGIHYFDRGLEAAQSDIQTRIDQGAAALIRELAKP